MSDHDKIDSILNQVSPARRDFLKRILGGSVIAALALPASSVLVEEAAAQREPGKKGKKGKKKKGKKGTSLAGA